MTDAEKNALNPKEQTSAPAARETLWGKNANEFGILILLLVITIILVGFHMIEAGIDRMLLAEKIIEKQLEIDLIAEQVNLSMRKHNDWDSNREHYTDSLITGLELLDRVPMTYAAVFDENLQNLSVRSPSYEGSPFVPESFPSYVEAVKATETGDLILPFTPPGSEERDMYLHYQWIPSDSALPHRFLAVVAISKYTISTKVSMWVQLAAVLLVLATFAIAIFIWRKQMAENLSRTLEETVRQRTVELEEQAIALETQTLSAQRASSAKSDFLSNMSHEMRTPLNAIIGMTSIAINSHELGRKDYCLKKIDDASSHLLNVINDILDMSKIEAKKFDLSIEKFNFERLLQKVANVLVFRVEEKRQSFTVHIDKNIPSFLLGDDQRIMQVITNLMSNAVKFTPEGGDIQLNAYLVEDKDNICTIKVEVIDTGIGISPEQQARLFSSFAQAESSTTRKYGGTGLGLAISKHIVEIMGGRIWLDSALGQGSTFTFTLQVEKAEEISSGLFAAGVNWENMSILVVDDAPNTREFFTDLMAQFNTRCDVAASGEEACAMVEEHGPYHLYFVDWHMPGMDGIEFSRRINAAENNDSVVVMISATEWSEIEASAKDAGINRFLSKPLFPSHIVDCINECLGSGSVVAGNHTLDDHNIFAGHRILLAEDVEVNREIVLSLLERTNLVIDTAENGLVAYEKFRDNPGAYDMIFMDVQMPDMDGYDATRKIRALDMPQAKKIPIVAMTANVFREDIEKCLACGMNDHIGKPINYDKMVSLLCGYLFTSNLHTGIS